MSRILALLALVFVVPLQAGIVVDPPAPTTATSIRVSAAGVFGNACSLPVDGPRISISGETIEVRYLALTSGLCVPVTTPWEREIALGTLPPDATR
ncbi:MAG TPA: hypothetical protein VF698_15070 [Thermoanaerobaculia bacterium]|jgi:hypothetical protein